MAHPESNLNLGLFLKEEILQAMTEAKPDQYERIRKFARHLCHRNIGMAVYGIPHVVSTDDLRERLPLEFLDQVGDNSFFGCIMRKKNGFIPVGYKPTRIPSGHARTIRIYTIEEYLPALRSFQQNNPNTL